MAERGGRGLKDLQRVLKLQQLTSRAAAVKKSQRIVIVEGGPGSAIHDCCLHLGEERNLGALLFAERLHSSWRMKTP